MSALLKLRDYQVKAIQAIHTQWNAGTTRPAVVLPTGAGKTVVFAHLSESFLVNNPGKRVLVLAHTDELVQQAARKMSEVAPGRRVGIVKATQNEVHAEVVVASVQSLRSKTRRDQLRNVGLIVVDECFPAGTLVGNRPIESLKPGDMVPTWDERTGEQTWRPVVAVMKRAPERMVRVTLEDGESFACTSSHPFLTGGGWCPAGMLSRDDRVVSFTHDAIAGCNHGDLLKLPHAVQHPGASAASMGHLPNQGQRVLHGLVPGHVGEPGLCGQDGADQPGARFSADEGTQPDEAARESREDVRHAPEDRAQAEITGWEREAGTGTSGAVGRSFGVADRGEHRTGGRGAALPLQRGHRSPEHESAGGGGRGIPLLAGAPRLRPAPGYEARLTRVADVQVLESGRDGTYGGVCSDGAVYNIEVAGTHTYLIGDQGTVVHNCHHAVSPTYRAILTHYGAMNDLCAECREASDEVSEVEGVRVWPSYCPNEGCVTNVTQGGPVKTAGFTATLVRGDKAKLSDVWESVAFKLSIAFMIRSGYLLDVKGKRVEVPDLNLAGVKVSGGDYQEGALGEALEEAFAPEIVAKAYAEHAAARKGILFAPLVHTAYAFCEAFNAAGIPSEVVHGAMPRDERRAVLARLRSGETQVVHNAMVLTEGFDEPTVSCVVVARPTKSSGLYQQMVGRGLRPDLTLAPAERGHALVLDVVGVSRIHGLQSLVDLSTRDDLPEDVDEDLTLLELEDLILDEPEEERGEGGAGEPETWYAGPAETREFDPLGRDSERTWGRTPEGTYYLRTSTTGYVFLAASASGEPGTYDLVWCSRESLNGSAEMTSHRGLDFEMALAWGEEEATERGGHGTLTLTSKKARWRKDPASRGMVYKLRQVPGWGGGKIRTDRDEAGEVTRYWFADTGETVTKGRASEIIDGAQADRRIDDLVRLVTGK